MIDIFVINSYLLLDDGYEWLSESIKVGSFVVKNQSSTTDDWTNEWFIIKCVKWFN